MIGHLLFISLAIGGFSFIALMVVAIEADRRKQKINFPPLRPPLIMAPVQIIVTINPDESIAVEVKRPPVQDARKFLFYVEGNQLMADLSLTTTQKANVVAAAVDNHENPAPLKDSTVPTWAAVTPGIVSLFPADNGLSADVVAVAAGTTDVRVSGISAHNNPFSSTFSVAVALAVPEATHFKFTFGAPTAQ